MIAAKFLWGNVFFRGKLQIDEKKWNFELFAKKVNFENFESALFMKSLSMPLTP